MIGILYYFIFIGSGVIGAMALFDDYLRHERLIIGLAIGVVSGAWLPAAFSLLLGRFALLSHILALVTLLLLMAWLLLFKLKRGFQLKHAWGSADKQQEKTLLWLLVPFTILIGIIFVGHVLVEKNGALYGGQSTFGDMSMHLGMITSIAKQGMFPPDYSIMPGQRLSYPFLVNSQSASLYLLGTPLRFSVLIPSMVMSILCFSAFITFAYRVAKKRSAVVIAFLLFFITGGLGFFYFLDDPQMFREIFTGFYRTPTNYVELNLRWVNVICDMMVPQRTTLMGWSLVLPTMMVLWRGINEGKNRDIITAGVFAGLLPMIHTHSFLALGMLCFGWLVIGGAYRLASLRNWIQRWLIFLVPVVVLAAPQLFFWIFTQSKGFVKVHLDWVNAGEPSLWFWVKNIGLPFVLIIPALIWGHKKYLPWYFGSVLIFVIAEIISFQPNFYDNNKLMLVWYMFTCVLVGDYIAVLWAKLKEVPGRLWLAVSVGIILFASGILTIMREVNSNGEYLLFNKDQIFAAECIDDKAPEDALFITGRQHLNAPAVLTGRNVYVGSGVYLHFHGLGYTERETEVKKMYTDPAVSDTLLEEKSIDYIYLSSYERYDFGTSREFFEHYPVVFDSGEIKILAVSQRAQDIGSLMD